MLAVHQETREAYGSERLWRELQDRGIAAAVTGCGVYAAKCVFVHPVNAMWLPRI
jgi:hypothetical protein